MRKAHPFLFWIVPCLLVNPHRQSKIFTSLDMGFWHWKTIHFTMASRMRALQSVLQMSGSLERSPGDGKYNDKQSKRGLRHCLWIPFLFSRVLLCGLNKDALIWIAFRCATVYNASLGLLFATPPPRLWPGVEGYRCVCVALGLLAWHSVVETTMPQPVRQWRVWFGGGERRGAFTPWHRTWHRARPSCLPG